MHELAERVATDDIGRPLSSRVLVRRASSAGIASRTLVLAYLGCVLVSKVADASEHPGFGYIPFVAVCFVLPFWYVSGRGRQPWMRRSWLLLLGQGAVTCLGFVLFGDHWVGGVAGLLGGLVLLVVRSPWSWWLFGLVAAGELSMWLLVGLPYRPSANAVGWVLVAFGNVGLGLFGLARLAIVVERLESTQDVLANASVAAQRLATANDVSSTITRQLEQVGDHVRNVLTDWPGSDSSELRLAGQAARVAAASARRLVTDAPNPIGVDAAAPSDGVTPALASVIVAAVAILFATQYILNLAVPVAGGASATVATSVLAVLVATSMVLLQLRHSRFRADGAPPRGWPWSLATQAVLCYVAYPRFGVVSTGFVAFLGGSVLLLLDRRVRWMIFGAVVAATPILTLLRPSDLVGLRRQVQWSIYGSATLAAIGLLVYGLSRLNRTAGELDIARRELAAVAVTNERLRIARDAHDTLGLGLSTIALKSDLAQSLLDRGDTRAHREVVHMLHLVRTVASDADSIIHGDLALDLDAELATARDVLTTAGVTTTITQIDVPIDTATGSEFAAILREAITNILRHSAAHECNIELARGGSHLSLIVDNDGAPMAGHAAHGHGLVNIADRAARMGGSMRTATDGERFAITIRVPSDHEVTS